MSPCLFALMANLIVLAALCFFGFWLGIIFTSNSARIYGEHCKTDSDCVKNMNYVCSNGLCNCTTTTYYIGLQSPCGKITKKLDICLFWIFNFEIKLREKQTTNCVPMITNAAAINIALIPRRIIQMYANVRVIGGGIVLFHIAVKFKLERKNFLKEL